MSKILTSFRLEKGDISYLESLVNEKTFNDKTKAIEGLIHFYRQENGYKVELKNKFAVMLENIYGKLIPFMFGCLFAYFFLVKKSLLFLPFLLVALTPFVLKLEAKSDNVLKVGL